jgi:hypothetical protein
MAQSATLMYTFGDASSLNSTNTIAPSTGFGSSVTIFSGLVRDQIFGSSLAIVLVGLGAPVEGSGVFRLTDLLSVVAPPAQPPEVFTLPSRIELVQIGEPETTAFDSFGGQFAESTTTPERASGLARALRDLEDFSDGDRDAEGGRGITREVIGEAARLLDLLPYSVPEPDVAAASDGSVCMEWENSAGSLWLDIEADRTARTLVMFGDKKQEMLFRVDDPKLPTYLRLAAARLYPDSRRLAIRSVMVPT